MPRSVPAAHLLQLLCHHACEQIIFSFTPSLKLISQIYLAFFFLCWSSESKPGEVHTPSCFGFSIQYHQLRVFLSTGVFVIIERTYPQSALTSCQQKDPAGLHEPDFLLLLHFFLSPFWQNQGPLGHISYLFHCLKLIWTDARRMTVKQPEK